MVFCSSCGFLQPPNVTTCPRCGAAVTPDQGAEGQNANDHTIITAPDKTEPAMGHSSSQPGLAHEPNQFVDYNSQTQRAEQGENTPVPPYMQNMPFPGYYQQAPVPPPPSPGHISLSDGNFSPTEGGPGYVPGPVFPANQRALPPQTKSNAALLAVLLILFLVIITIVATTIVFVIGPDRRFQAVSGGGVGSQPPQITSTSQATTPSQPTPTSQMPTPTTPTLTPNQQAQSVITRYYSAINSKDYQTAYNLWVNYPDTYQNFANGFSDTQRDDYQFGQFLPQGDGTLQVNITLVATSTSSQQTTYQGYYIVGQQSDGSWKIIKASLNAV